MKKIKIALASTILTGSFLVADLNVEEVREVSAAETVTSWYEYNGEAGYDATFVLDQSFVDAVKEDNVKMNGIELKMNPKAFDEYAKANTEVVKKYDQVFNVVKNKEYSYSTVIEVKTDNLKVKDVKKLYEKYIEIEDKEHISLNVDGQKIQFDVKNGIVKRITLGV